MKEEKSKKAELPTPKPLLSKSSEKPKGVFIIGTINGKVFKPVTTVKG